MRADTSNRYKFAARRATWWIGRALVVGLIVTGVPAAYGATQTRSPGSNCTNDTSIGTDNWSNAADAVSSNNQYSTVNLNDGEVSNYLRCFDYGFTIPSGAVINGIIVSIERRSSNANTHRDSQVRLLKAGVIGATNRATATIYPTGDTYEDHGGAADLWGDTWSAADINDPNFGVVFAAIKYTTAGGNRTVRVDHIAITVDYTVPAPINTYYPGTASIAAGATSITLGAASGVATPIAVGDLLIIMQMQDATINSTNTAAYGNGVAGDPGSGATAVGGSGLYEYAVAASAVPLAGGTLTLSCGTTNAYTNAAATGTEGQKRFQVIRVPVYANYTLTALTATAWDGSSGGVLAFDVTGTLSLNSGVAVVNGLGFRGGAARGLTGPAAGAVTDYVTLATNANNGSKGEGIAGTPRYIFTSPSTLTNTGVEGYPNGSHARGAPGNAGGGGTDGSPTDNQENTGGGGGANGGDGGKGGIGWCGAFNAGSPPNYGCDNSGGFGGTAVSGLGATRLTLGGGGGSGTTNNSTGSLGALSTSGAAGGGIIMVRAGAMTGSGTFSANGADANSTIQNDGSGGAGAGGAVLISAGSGMAGATINVRGGTGGSNLIGSGGVSPHGPGGGGGGGFALTSGATASCSASGGTNGVTYNNGVLFGAYGSTAGSNGSCLTSLNSASIPGSGIGGVPACPLNHYAISHSGSGVNCQAEPVTISAHNGTHAAVTVASNTITVSTSTGSGDWSLVTGTGVFNNGAANDGSATYQFNSETEVVLNLKHTTPGSVNLNVTDGSATETSGAALATEDQNLVFAPSGFRITDGTNPVNIGTQIAGKPSSVAPGAQNLNLQAIRTDTNTGACVGVFANNTDVAVDLASQCVNPTTCIGGQQVAITNNAVTTAIASNPNAGVASYTPVTLRFGANSQAPFSLSYSDAGSIRLYARYVIPLDGGGPSSDVMQGSSNAFVVRPFGFRISGPPAGVSGPSSAAFIAAEQGFDTTVTAVVWQAPDDANTDGVPDSQAALAGNAGTPNFGLETSPATAALTHILAEPAAGTGSLTGATTFSGFVAGARTQSVAFNEVGIIDLLALTTDYLGGGQNISAGANGLTGVGRFIPAYFNVSVVPGCGGFTYSGQPFNSVGVEPRGAANGAINNYRSSYGFAKDVTISNAGDATNFSNNVLLGASAFTGSSGSSATVTYTFPTKETVPMDLTLRATEAAPPSGDSVSSVGHIEPSPVGIRSGRAVLQNAFGSELIALAMPFRIQYYDAGGFFTTNTLDSCTSITNLTLSNNIGAPVTGPSGTSKAVNGAVTTTATFGAFANGDAGLAFSAPGPGGDGYVDVTPGPGMLPLYLKFDWDGNGVHDNDPVGRATFGIYKGSPRHIYLRERY